MVLSHVIFEK
jgi:hypothetical protein